MDVIETTDISEWDNDDYTHEGISVKVYHHQDNDGENNRHAIVIGDTAVVLEQKRD